jgi:copper resistance protein C
MPHVTGQRTSRRSHTAALGAGALVAAAFALLAPLPAYAHATLISSRPSDGAVLARVPTEVVFTFDEAVASPAFVSVIGPDGANIADGDAVIDEANVTQAVRLVPTQGPYSASFRVVSDDGHPVTGTVHFTVDRTHGTSAPSTSSASACTDGCLRTSAGTPFWHRESTWVVIALGALAVAIALVFAFGLPTGPASSDPGGDG